MNYTFKLENIYVIPLFRNCVSYSNLLETHLQNKYKLFYVQSFKLRYF